MLPAYLANVSALVFGGGKPLDFKRNFWDGNRILGNGKTWRGVLIGTLVGTGIGLIQGIVSPEIIEVLNNVVHVNVYYYSIFPVNIIQGALLGFSLSAGAMIGDLIGSFIKRRLKIKRGSPAPLLDQLDFAVGAILLSSLVVSIPFALIIAILLVTLFLHLLTNMIAYLLGLKDVWY